MAKVRVLFVCMGNICRSPAAEGILLKKVKERGLENQIEIDSAGTTGFHVGEPADPRMQRAAAARGIKLTSKARQVAPDDFRAFDYVLAADPGNLRDLEMMADRQKHQSKLRLITESHPDPSIGEVPDPYYGGTQGFENVLDVLEASCDRLLDEIEEDLKKQEV